MANNSSVTRFVRYRNADQESYGVLAGETIHRLDGPFLDGAKETGETMSVSAVELLTPISPERVSKIVGVNGNYQPADGPKQFVPHPPVFIKFATSLVTDGDDVELPSELKAPYLGPSLMLVIGKEGRNIARENAAEHIFGLAVANDISDAASWGREFGDMVPDRMLSKASDTWAPMGTQIVSGLDYSDLTVEAKLNGKTVTSGRTSRTINDVASLLHYLSHYFTLSPGDLIFTGFPQPASGPVAIKPGDTMTVEIEGLGRVTNPCTELKIGAGRHWWHELEDEKTAEQAAAGPSTGG